MKPSAGDEPMPGAQFAAASPPPRFRVATRWGTFVALLVFAGLLSGGSPGGLLSPGPFSSNFFDVQAEALLDGRLDVPPEVAGLEGFVHDGKTHLYFGLVPALVRLPVAAVSDGFSGRLTQISMLAALAVATWASGRLLWRARLRTLGDHPVAAVELWAAGAFVGAVGLSSPLLFLASRPLVYHEVELWGTATALLAIEAALAWWGRPTGARLALASLAVVVALNTRASVGGGSLVALALVLALAVVGARVPRRTVPFLVLAVLVPVAAYGAVNTARFGSLFSVPFEEQVQSGFPDAARQAALDATDGTLFGIEFAPTAVLAYLRPDGVALQQLFPWLTFRESHAIIGEPKFDSITRSASLPVVAPAFFALAAVGLLSLLRSRLRDPWLAVALGTAAGIASTLTIAIVANRYLADFTPALVVLAAVGLWPAVAWLAQRRAGARAAGFAALGGLVLLGLLVSSALALQGQRLLLLPDRQTRLEFVALQYDLHERVAGGRPPQVERTRAVGELDGHRGDVAIQGRCEALYWNDGTRWWPLELAGDLQWELEGELAEGRTTLVEGDGWAIVADATGDSVRFAYRRDGAPIIAGQDHPATDVAGRTLTVRLDRVNGEAVVEMGGETAFVAGLALLGIHVDLDGPVQPGPSWQATPGRAPECEVLQARLDRRRS